jgi:hypothetical protein
LDLDKGKVVRMPEGFASLPRLRQNVWLRGRGVDLMVLGGAVQDWSLASPVDHPLKLTRVEAAAWDGELPVGWRDSEPEPSETIQLDGLGLVQVRLPGRPPHSDSTFVFETADGSRGLLQIRGFWFDRNDEPAGLKIRFRKLGRWTAGKG